MENCNIIINKQNLLDNFEMLNKISNKEILAVIKANAYGHNSKCIVDILQNCKTFCVFTLTEALEIRKLTNKKIIIMGNCTDYAICEKNNFEVKVESLNDLVCAKKQLQGKTLNVHIKINSGMNRFGVKDKVEYQNMLNFLKRNTNLNVAGIYTHFLMTSDRDITTTQINVFKEYVEQCKKYFNPKVHVGGSGAIDYEIPFADAIRCGSGLFGYTNEHLKPIMKISAKIVTIQHLKAGDYVGYDKYFQAQKDMKIGLVMIGYADGITGTMNTNLKAYSKNGDMVDCVGKICMDTTFFDISNTNLQIGDELVLFDNATAWQPFLNLKIGQILTNFSCCRGDIIIE